MTVYEAISALLLKISTWYRAHILKAPSTPIPSRPTPEIPSDLYGLIIQHLAQPELVQCLRVCKEFHDHAIPRLYESVIIRIDHLATGGTDDPTCPVRELSSKFLALALPTKSNSQPSLSYNPFIRPPPIPNTLAAHLYNHTKHLIINNHSHFDCARYALLHMPNLITLRFRPGHADYTDRRPGGPCGCIVAHLRPQRLIIGSGGARHSSQWDSVRSVVGVWPLPGSRLLETIPISIKQIMILIDENDGAIQHSGEPPPLERIPATVEKLVLVLPSSLKDWAVWGEGWGLGLDPIVLSRVNPRPAKRDSSGYKQSFAITAASGRAQSVHFFGYKPMASWGREESADEAVQSMKWMARCYLMEEALDNPMCTAAEADERVDKMVFTLH